MNQAFYDHPEAERIIDICRLLHDKNLLAAGDGNISYRIDENRILITPSGKNKRWIDRRDLCLILKSGEVVAGMPSSEMEMHLEVYRRCSEARAVVHAHPPHAIAWTIAQPEMQRFPMGAISELILGVGDLPIAPFAMPGSFEMAKVLSPLIIHHRVVVLARHGALSWGQSLVEAYNGMERLEHSAWILKLAKEMGAITELPEATQQELRRLRSKLGPESR